jgi:hypothetical protein
VVFYLYWNVPPDIEDLFFRCLQTMSENSILKLQQAEDSAANIIRAARECTVVFETPTLLLCPFRSVSSYCCRLLSPAAISMFFLIVVIFLFCTLNTPDRNSRLKQAKLDASTEIAQYREMKERKFAQAESQAVHILCFCS